jgi:hypothetical protein
MLETSKQLCDIDIVRDIQSCNGITRILFSRSSSTALPANHPHYDLLLRQAEASLRHQFPIAVLLDTAGTVADLSEGHQVTVRRVQQDEDGVKGLRIALWELSPVCYLAKDHPDFERIRDLLLAAEKSGERLWLANRSWPVEEETEVWNSILDVRPAADVLLS